TVSFELTDLTGKSLGTASIPVPGNGQTAKFVSDIFPSVSLPLKGVLRVSTAGSSVAVAELRGRYNERGDFLMSTTPPTNENVAPPASAIVVPHIVNGGGFITQFILFSGAANQAASGELHLTYAN